MPDWSYRTVFRPLLFRLPFPLARNLALGSMGLLSRLPLGGAVIDFLGHMRPDPRLRTPLGPLQLSSPVVIGPWLDRKIVATAALSRFGVGMIELAPGGSAAASDARCEHEGRPCLRIPAGDATIATNRNFELLERTRSVVPLMLRLAPSPGSVPETTNFLCNLSLHVLPNCRAAISLATLEQAIAEQWPQEEWRKHVESIQFAMPQTPPGAQPLFLVLPADADSARALPYLQSAAEHSIAGLVVDGRISDGDAGWLIGRPAFEPALALTRRLREELGSSLLIIAGGADDPLSALELLAAGANAVQIDAALAFAGPGLPKRINDAVLFARCHSPLSPRGGEAGTPTPLSPRGRGVGGEGAVSAAEQPHAAAMSWFWALLLGAAMLIGGTMALAFAATRVLLPYDEAYLGMTADELSAKVPRVLAFMAHDRVTLAGTMLAVGIQYVCLAWFGIRRGLHWAKLTVVASAFAGFLSFFLFLGFGYFDPLHAFVTAILFQFLLLAFQGRLGPAEPPAYPNLREDWRWRLANWGQLLLVVQGAAIITAGITISSVGITAVFVAEDLEFMHTTAEALREANPRLIPVVAHDRASFGGMLISVGLATLLPALWGIRQGERWLWAMLAIAGTVAYDATLLVHFCVGYTDPLHLAPAFGGLALLWLALALLFPYLFVRDAAQIAEWDKLLEP
jgi:dihydroorotate dehydrogenase